MHNTKRSKHGIKGRCRAVWHLYLEIESEYNSTIQLSKFMGSPKIWHPNIARNVLAQGGVENLDQTQFSGSSFWGEKNRSMDYYQASRSPEFNRYV